jgi:hypothetical protein
MTTTTRFSPSPSPVVLIAGGARSGSTLLGMLLGAQPNAVFLGESNRWTSNNRPKNAGCGCGVPFEQCEFWTTVRNRAGVDLDAFQPDDFEYVDGVVRIQQVAREVSGANVVIDSSKDPRYLRKLASHRKVEPVFIHVLRDPRATLVSAYRGWRVKRDLSTPPSLWLAFRVGLYWRRINRRCQRLIRTPEDSASTIRYEDLAADPERIIHELGQLAGIRAGRFVTDIGQQHVPNGNPSRFSSGHITVAVDDAWRSALPLRYQRVVCLLGYPLTARFGYRVG